MSVFSEKEKSEIANRIALVETKTQAEIVIAMTLSSTPVGHLWILWTAFTLLFGQALIHSLWPWSSGILQQIALVCLSLLSGVFLSRFAFLNRLVFSNETLESQCRTKALAFFYQSDIKKTQEHTGVLVFISEFEHQVIILADQTTNRILERDFLNQCVKLLSARLKSKQAKQGIDEILDKLETVLSAQLPSKTINENEVPNHVIELKATT